MSSRLLPGLPVLLLALALGAPAHGEDPPADPAALVRELLGAEREGLQALETRVRALGPAVVPALRAAHRGAAPEGRARIERVLAGITEDVHRAATPEGMVYVPAGPLEVPRTHAPWGPSGTRAPVRAFYLDRTEVTVGAWRAWRDALAKRGDVAGLEMLPAPPEDADARLPMTRVPWPAACRYAREVRGGRLPTAEEYERALRGSASATYPWGETVGKDVANLRGLGPDAPLPVGSLPAGRGAFGALDLVGNVAEWSSTTVPQGRAGHEPLLFGGSFRQDPDPALVWRGRDRMRAPVASHEQLDWVGFRVARDVPALPE